MTAHHAADSPAVRPTTTDPATLRERLVTALTRRRARIQLLTGPLGSGASSTLAAVASELRGSGRRVLPIAGIAGLEDVPYGALGPVLASLAPHAESTEQALHRLFAAAAPARSRLMLVVDDAPALDPASAGVVAQLVRIYGLPAIVASRTRRLLPDALAGLVAEGLVDETPVGLSMRDEHIDERLGSTVVRALSSLDDGSREVAEQLAILGPLPAACIAGAVADTLEDAGLLVRSRGEIVRLPHEGFARVIREQLPRGRESSTTELVTLLRRICPDVPTLADATRLVGYHRAIELRRPEEAVALGESVVAAAPEAEADLARHLGSWRSMVGVMVAEPAAGHDEPLQAVIRGHQRIAAAMMRADISGGRTAVREMRQLIEAAGAALEMGTLVADIGEYHLTALAGEATALAEMAERAREGDRLPPLWEATIAYYRLRSSDELQETMDLARSAFHRLEWHEFFGTRAITAGVWATAAARLGRAREARHALGQLSRETRPWSLVDLQAAEAEAWILAMDGRAERASEVLSTALARAADSGYWGFGTVSAIAGIRFGYATEMLDFLDPAAEASSESIAPHVRELATAITVADEERRRVAEAWLCSAGFLPPSAHGPGSDDLSPREREIAQAAVVGESAKAIGERLGLSHRTVETHLQNVYRKLGVASRRELADAFTPRAPGRPAHPSRTRRSH